MKKKKLSESERLNALIIRLKNALEKQNKRLSTNIKI